MFKDLGPAISQECDNCHNEEFWHLCKSSVWATLFFIPVFPYQRDKLLVCPVCRAAMTLTKEQFEELRPVAETNQALAEGKITEAEHHHRITQLSLDKPDGV